MLTILEAVAMPPDEISRAHRAGEHNNNNKPNNKEQQ